MKINPLRLKSEPGATPIHLADAVTFFGQEAIDAGEKRLKIETCGSWDTIIKARGLAVSAEWEPGPCHDQLAYYTLYGDRDLIGCHESGYQLEGIVSIGGVKYRAFTSSALFEIIETEKLVNIAVLHVRIHKPVLKGAY